MSEDLEHQLEEAKLQINHLESQLHELEHQSFPKRLKVTTKYGVRSLKFRVKRALQYENGVEWSYRNTETLLQPFAGKSVAKLLQSAQEADMLNYQQTATRPDKFKMYAYKVASLSYRATRTTTRSAVRTVKKLQGSS